MSLSEKLLRERQRTDSQRPEAWLLRDYLKQRRARARRGFSRSAAAPDRPVLVASCPVGRPAVDIPSTGRTGRPATSERRP